MSDLTTLNMSGCTGLDYLDASAAEALVTLDASGCTALTTLELSGLSALTTLNMSGCSALQWADGKLNTSPCDDGLKLASLVTLDVSGCTQLQSLFAYLHESLTTLNASGCTALEYVGAYENAKLASVDVSGCTALTDLDLPANPCLTEMNMSGCTALGYLNCLNAPLTSLDVSECTELYQLECNGTQISMLDAYNCPALEYLVCWSENLEYVIINPDLEYLYLELYDENFDTTWTFQAADETILSSEVTAYEYVAENVSELPVTATSADESQTVRIVTKTPMDAPTLTAATASINSVTVTVSEVEDASGYLLEYSANEDFSDAMSQNVLAGDTTITGLDLEGATVYFRVKALTGNIFLLDSEFTDAQSVVYYDANDVGKARAFFEQADDEGITNGTKLFGDAYDANDTTTWFNDDNEGATFAEVDGVMRLAGFEAFEYGLVGTLDLSDCTELTSLTCSYNQLTALDVSGCENLEDLRCWNNQLTSINISGCNGLTKLYCYDNQLTTLDVSEFQELTELYCGGNLLTTVDVTECASLTVLDCWSASLNFILINSEQDLNIAFIDAECCGPWTFVDADGNTIEIEDNGENFVDYYYSAENDSLPITATNTDGTQTIIIANEIAPLATPTLSEATVEMAKVSFTWDADPNATEYQFEYKAVGSDEWLTKTVKGTSASFVGELDTAYTARVKALGAGAFLDSEYSAEQAVAPLQIVATFNAKKVTVSWLDASPTADTIRYRVANTAKWTTKKLKAGVTSFTFSPKAGTNYEFQVLLDQQEANILQGPIVMLDQAKLKADKAAIQYDSFQVNVTNYTAKNLADNVTQAILTVNGVQTTVDIEDQFGESDLANGGKVTFENGLFTFTDMASNTKYDVQVSFTDDVCVSTMSKLSVKTVKASYEAPVITSATPLTDTSIEVTWETAYGQKSDTPAQKYTVQYSLDGNKWSNATTGATGNSFLIQKLKGGNVYHVRVLATKDNAFNASAASAVLDAETLATPKMALVKASLTSSAFQISVANYAGSNLGTATALNVRSDLFGDVVIIVVNGAGSTTFGNGMTVAFENGTLTFDNAPANTQQKIQISFGNGVCTTAWSAALSVKTAKAA
ncbi:MAG: fibronectin type III domain-containing protein [Thermoguttaceae bacterium]|nr:fibronectin type III domain-containing protein [Thermoguttaceae bacterium]